MFYEGSTYQPQNNLKSFKYSAQPEKSLTEMFAHNIVDCLRKRFDDVVLVYEFPMVGYGIADIVVKATSTVKRKQDNGTEKEYQRSVLYSYEVKITDWRKALSQAYRYRYYSNKSAVVLPEVKARTMIKYISTFSQLGVDIILVDEVGNISQRPTSTRVQKPLNLKANYKARERIVSLVELG